MRRFVEQEQRSALSVQSKAWSIGGISAHKSTYILKAYIKVKVLFLGCCVRVLGRLAGVREVPSITIREMTDLVTASWEKQEEVVFGG